MAPTVVLGARAGSGLRSSLSPSMNGPAMGSMNRSRCAATNARSRGLDSLRDLTHSLDEDRRVYQAPLPRFRGHTWKKHLEANPFLAFPRILARFREAQRRENAHSTHTRPLPDQACAPRLQKAEQKARLQAEGFRLQRNRSIRRTRCSIRLPVPSNPPAKRSGCQRVRVPSGCRSNGSPNKRERSIADEIANFLSVASERRGKTHDATHHVLRHLDGNLDLANARAQRAAAPHRLCARLARPAATAKTNWTPFASLRSRCRVGVKSVSPRTRTRRKSGSRHHRSA